MSHSTHAPHHRSRAPLPARALVCAAVLALAWGWSAASARADGDPASDVLATQPLFLAQDAGVPPRRAAQLASLLDEAQRSGAPIRVALIASPA
ncbi:MAG: hypothetical protein FWD42_10900, partial [Solirubrobacterales bacterium]|nr:hypothetical protein [Solirubrobacterales bacterium]